MATRFATYMLADGSSTKSRWNLVDTDRGVVLKILISVDARSVTGTMRCVVMWSLGLSLVVFLVLDDLDLGWSLWFGLTLDYFGVRNLQILFKWVGLR